MSQKNVGPYRLLSSKDVYSNPWIRVREDSVLRPDGQQGIFGIVKMVPGASVLALTAEDDVYLAREYKYGIGRYSIELMSGALEAGESPLDAAKRELKEEFGVEAGEWIDLGRLDPFTTVINSPNYMFLALDIAEGFAPDPDPGEEIEILKVPFAQVVSMVMNSEITHGASCVLVLKADRYLRERGSVKGHTEQDFRLEQ